MAISWEHKEENVKEFKGYEVIPVGEYRIRIEEAVEQKSKEKNLDMIKLTFAVSGSKTKIFYYIVFMPEKPEVTDTNLANIWKSFNLEKTLDLTKWIGKVGAAKIKHQKYNDNTNAVINFFLTPEKAKSLPDWVEPEKNIDNAGVAEGDVPF